MNTLNQLTIEESLKNLKTKKISSHDLVKDCIERIKKTDKKINAVLTLCEEDSLSQAKKADKMYSEKKFLPLLGIPVLVKDNFNTIGIETTASSKVLKGYIPIYDATVVSKLKKAGAIILGKTNMDAWAHGSSTETSDFGSTLNPWNTDFLPGGSSGGSAASVSTDQTIFAIGSETAGSIRQPASWCSIVGLKPTYGRVSRYGVIAMASSTDSPGPMTKTVYDSAYILNLLAGNDGLDATCSDLPVEDYTKNLKDSVKNKKIGVSDLYLKNVEAEVASKFYDFIKVYEKLGAKIINLDKSNVNVFDPKYSIAVYTIIQRSEVSSNLARYDGVRYGNPRTDFGLEAKRRIMLGTYTLSAGYYDAYYKKALKVRTQIIENFHKIFAEIDIFAAPTSPTPPLPVGSSKNHPMFGEVADVLVEPSSIAGLPGINIPAGFSKDELPIGMQLIGPQFSESEILNFAYQYEQKTNWNTKKPKL